MIKYHAENEINVRYVIDNYVCNRCQHEFPSDEFGQILEGMQISICGGYGAFIDGLRSGHLCAKCCAEFFKWFRLNSASEFNEDDD